MIVIGPPEPEAILARFLDLGGAVAAFPILAFRAEYGMTCQIAPGQSHHAIEQGVSLMEPFGFIGELAGPRAP
jgi:hypothetical protein